jgi:hypothetical protein
LRPKMRLSISSIGTSKKRMNSGTIPVCTYPNQYHLQFSHINKTRIKSIPFKLKILIQRTKEYATIV